MNRPDLLRIAILSAFEERLELTPDCCPRLRVPGPSLSPREEDPQLHDFYASNLLQPGWGGLLTLEEARYVRDCLEQDSKLRRSWGIRGKKVPLSVVAEIAFPEDRAAARRYIEAEQARARRKRPARTKMSPAADTEGERAGVCLTIRRS